jgi:hypothetical protein
MVRKVQERVPLLLCRERALAALSKTQLMPASAVAEKIWPGTIWTNQGAGAAASRILKSLQNDNLVAWRVLGKGKHKTWGWCKL